ncbi:hypothetical protein V6Z11_D02G096100 [Gossypium hirsutum]|uniref:Uncharacterized protein n=1 Tax=Gossypium hirsutum TaxID=3635 RepID=A0ABM2ZP06_GOSHI|nr:uncharacterized protein LOC121214627 [Gossypium hirsutum]
MFSAPFSTEALDWSPILAHSPMTTKRARISPPGTESGTWRVRRPAGGAWWCYMRGEWLGSGASAIRVFRLLFLCWVLGFCNRARVQAFLGQLVCNMGWTV